MAQKNDKYNTNSNIQQIILQNELIFLAKEIVFIIVLAMSWIGWGDVLQIENESFSNLLVFGLTTAIDASVLAKQFKLKGILSNILLAYIILTFFGLAFIFLVITGTLSISAYAVYICDLIGIFYCGGPLIEMACDVMSHLQNEKLHDY